jgi:hypothetical protein
MTHYDPIGQIQCFRDKNLLFLQLAIELSIITVKSVDFIFTKRAKTSRQLA